MQTWGIQDSETEPNQGNLLRHPIELASWTYGGSEIHIHKCFHFVSVFQKGYWVIYILICLLILFQVAAGVNTLAIPLLARQSSTEMERRSYTLLRLFCFRCEESSGEGREPQS